MHERTLSYAQQWQTHAIALGVAIVGVVALFARDAGDMVNQWWNSSTYGHCLFIVPLTAWLIWQRRREVVQVEPRAWPFGLVVVGFTAFGWLIGDAAGIALVRHMALIATVQAVTLVVIGPSAVRVLLFPILYLSFLVPVGDEIVPAMQTLTAKMTMILLQMAGVAAHIDGVFITTSAGWFEVAEACAGVKFLVAMLAYGALVANVCFRSWTRRLVFMIACVVVPIVANGVRAFGTIFAAQLTSVEAATGFDHIVYGWFFFAFVMVVVMAAAWPFFDRRIGEPWLTDRPVAIGKPRSAVATAIAALGLVALPIIWSGVVVAAGRQALPNRITLPTITGWVRVPADIGYPWAPRFDGADHRLLGRYRDATGRMVDLAVALYGWQGDGRKIIGYGQGAVDPTSKWSWSAKIPAISGGSAQRMRGPGRVEREAVTFYVLGGGATGDAMTVKLRTMKAKLFGGDQSAAVIIVSAAGRDRAAIEAFLNALGPVDDQAQTLLARAKAQ